MRALALILLIATGAHADEKRPVPDYDGRPEPTTAGDVALWFPRVILFPAYLVAEYGLRRPLGWIGTSAEQDRWPGVFLLFVLNRDPVVAIVPTVYFDFGLKPSVGFYLLGDDILVKGNDIRFKFGFWGFDWVSFGVTDRFRLGKQATLALQADWTKRPDYAFYGLGPSSRKGDRSRYRAKIVETALWLDVRVLPHIPLRAGFGLRRTEFRSGSCCGDPALADQIEAGVFPAVPGFPDGYEAMFEHLEVAYDSRSPRPAAQSGFRLALRGELAADFDKDNDWVRYGATAGGFWDVTGTARVLSLTLTTDFVRDLRGAVPFTEQVSLGGAGPLVGFGANRLIGESAISAALRYEWPVWVYLNGTIAAEVGNVLGRDLDGFALGLMRLSLSIGVRTTGGRDAQFQFLIGMGTDPFDEGMAVTSFRLAFGGTYGF